MIDAISGHWIRGRLTCTIDGEARSTEERQIFLCKRDRYAFAEDVLEFEAPSVQELPTAPQQDCRILHAFVETPEGSMQGEAPLHDALHGDPCGRVVLFLYDTEGMYSGRLWLEVKRAMAPASGSCTHGDQHQLLLLPRFEPTPTLTIPCPCDCYNCDSHNHACTCAHDYYKRPCR